jgi:prohibitin 2
METGMNVRNESTLKKVIKYGAGGVAILLLILTSFSTVENGHVGFRKTLGSVSPTVLEPGPHWKWPFISSIVEVNTQVAKSEADAAASSKDLQPVHSHVAVNYTIPKGVAYKLLHDVGLDFDTKVINPHVQEIFKEVTAKYSAEELISKRERVALETNELLKKALEAYNIQVGDISIVNFTFSDAFNQSIEQKQIAAQNAMKAQNDLDKAKIDAQQNVVKAEADATAAKAKADADLYVAQQKAKGNIELAKSITADLVDYKFLESWKGDVPDAWGNGSLINMLPSKTPVQPTETAKK